MVEGLDDEIVLGGNIVLTGFNKVDGASMIILKKLIGNHVRRISDHAKNFEKINLTVKGVGKGTKFEVHGIVVDNGSPYTADHTDRNIFVTVDTVLKKIHNSMDL